MSVAYMPTFMIDGVSDDEEDLVGETIGKFWKLDEYGVLDGHFTAAGEMANLHESPDDLLIKVEEAVCKALGRTVEVTIDDFAE